MLANPRRGGLSGDPVVSGGVFRNSGASEQVRKAERMRENKKGGQIAGRLEGGEEQKYGNGGGSKERSGEMG